MATSPAAFDPNREDTDETLAALSLRSGAVPWDSRPLLGPGESGGDSGRAREQISERFTRSQAVQQIDAIRMPAPTLLAGNREIPREPPRTMPRESPTSYDTLDDAWLISPLAASSPPSHALKRTTPTAAPRVQMPSLPTAAVSLAAAETWRSPTIPVTPIAEAPQPARVFGVSLFQLAMVSFFAAWVAVVLAMAVNTL